MLTTDLVACSDVIPRIDGGVVRSAVTQGQDQHREHEMIFVVEGTYRALVGRRAFALESGAGVIYPAGCRHSGRDTPRDGTTRLLVVQWAGDCLAGTQTAQTFDDPNGRIRAGLIWLNSLDWREEGHAQLRQSLWNAIYEQINWQLTRSEDTGDELARLHMLISRLPHTRITLTMLSTRSGMSIPTIIHQFKQRYGMPPMQFLQKIRAEKAANLIRTTAENLEVIAQQVGLESRSHLSRLLKKHIGQSARALRRAR